MRISENGKNLIKKYEGCRLESYYCPSGVLTIGWGHTKNVYEGQTITQNEADRLFNNDIEKYYPSTLYGSFNQNQFDALTSFSYNCGLGALDDVLTSGNITGTMLLYVNGSYGKLEGLVKRRYEEVELFNTPILTNNNSYYEEGTATVLCDVLNIRHTPSLNGLIDKEKYYKGEQIQYYRVHKAEGYYWIEYLRNNGSIGYVASRKCNNSELYLQCK